MVMDELREINEMVENMHKDNLEDGELEF